MNSRVYKNKIQIKSIKDFLLISIKPTVHVVVFHEHKKLSRAHEKKIILCTQDTFALFIYFFPCPFRASVKYCIPLWSKLLKISWCTFFKNMSYHYFSVNETTLDHIIIVISAVRSIDATQSIRPGETLDVHIQ